MIRRHRLWLAAISAALLWAGALLAFLMLRPRDATDRAYPVRPEFAGIAGVNLETNELVDARLARTLADLAAGGIRWVRFTLPWEQIEPARGQFNWAQWDAVFAALAQHPALQPVVVLNGSPAWARAAADAANPQAPPHERADFGAFAAALAQRYGAQLRYYQVWHEPNIAPHWGARPADPAGYLGLLREAAVQLRAGDRDAQIVLAALAPTTEEGGANLSDIAYLDALYNLGGRAWFDVVAGQPYGFAQPPDAPADPATLNFARASLLRAVMIRHGDGGTPLWGTAFGWNSDAQSPWGGVDEALQPRYAAQALARARAAWPWLGPLFWTANCPERPADDSWLGFTLCRAGGGRRPVWDALTAAVAAPDVLPAGRHAVNHPALRYSPGWRVTPSAADPGGDGDTLDFAFDGAGLALAVQRGPYWAYYRLTVDGAPANALPHDESGAAYLALHDPLAGTAWVPVARNLAPGEHRVHLEATGGWGQWALQGVEVTADTVRPVWIIWALAALALLVSTLTIALALPQRRRVAVWLAARLDAAAAGPGTFLWLAAGVCVLLLAFSPHIGLDLAALAGLGLLFLVRPDLALPLVAASLPFWQRPARLARWEFAHFELFLWLGALALAARLIISGSRPVDEATRFAPLRARFSSLDWPVLALLLSGLLSTIVAQAQGVAWHEFRVVFLGGALYYGLITRAPMPAGRSFSPWPLLNGLLAGMVAVSLVALWQLITGQGRVDVEGVWRVRALYGSPNNLALVLDRAIPLALALAAFGGTAYARTHVQRRQDVALAGRGAMAPGGENAGAGIEPSGGLAISSAKASMPQRWGGMSSAASRTLYALAAGVMALACLATFSKGALLLGLPAGVGLVLSVGARRRGQRWPLWALGGLALAAALLLALLFRTPRFADLFNFGSGTSFVRIKLWLSAWQMALAHPVLGVGPDNFLYAYRTYYVLPSAWAELNLSHPHNILLDLWTRLGGIGVLAGGWALLAGWRRGWRLISLNGRAPVAGFAWPIVLGLLGALAATVAHGLIDNSLFLVDLMGVFMLTLGVYRRLSE